MGALLAGNEYEAVGLIKAGVEVNTAENTTSPLHASVSCITSTVTKLLIAHGADVNARNDVGERALHLAARLNHINAVRLLLRHGAVVNVWSRGRSCSKQPKSEFNCGWTSLHEACEQGNEAITRELLSNGAHVDVRTATGRSPLDLAVEDNPRTGSAAVPRGCKVSDCFGLNVTQPWQGRAGDGRHFQLHGSEDPRQMVEAVWSRIQMRARALVGYKLGGESADGTRSRPEEREWTRTSRPPGDVEGQKEGASINVSFQLH
jgi:Ankyrin repeats (3 copies)/Ankyrin repeat